MEGRGEGTAIRPSTALPRSRSARCICTRLLLTVSIGIGYGGERIDTTVRGYIKIRRPDISDMGLDLAMSAFQKKFKHYKVGEEWDVQVCEQPDLIIDGCVRSTTYLPRLTVAIAKLWSKLSVRKRMERSVTLWEESRHLY